MNDKPLDLTWAVVTRDLKVGDEVVIGGIRYVREGTVPEGFEERWTTYSPSGLYIPEPSQEEAERHAVEWYGDPNRAVPIYVETQQEDDMSRGIEHHIVDRPASEDEIREAREAAFFGAVMLELGRAYAKHGDDQWGRHEFYGILREEFDELWDAIKADEPQFQVESELLQIAAVCLRYYETRDRYRTPRRVETQAKEGDRVREQ